MREFFETINQYPWTSAILSLFILCCLSQFKPVIFVNKVVKSKKDSLKP